MNILMLAPLPPPSGGIASWALRYRDYCKSNNIPLRIVNTAMQGERATSEVMKRSLKIELQRTIGIVKCLVTEIKKEKPDVIHVNTSCSPLGVLRDALCILSVQKIVPVVLHCHCNIEDQLGEGVIQRKIFQMMVRRSLNVIVLNEFSQKYIESIDKEKAVIIPNFVNEQMLRYDHQISESIKNVVYVGHIEKSKGICQIAIAAEQLPEISFTLVGASREDLSSISFPSNVEFVGRVSAEKVQDYLERADAFVFPSFSEGFSIALLEAMAAGLPIITTNVGANAEMIESYGGVILKENTGEELYKAILSIENPLIRQSMSKWNMKKVKSSYMINEIMAKYIDLYKNAI